jgi:hypothetical protein
MNRAFQRFAGIRLHPEKMAASGTALSARNSRVAPDKVPNTTLDAKIGVRPHARRHMDQVGSPQPRSQGAPNWHHALIRLAKKRVWHYRRLIQQVRSAS